jgi:hypothetical protein
MVYRVIPAGRVDDFTQVTDGTGMRGMDLDVGGHHGVNAHADEALQSMHTCIVVHIRRHDTQQLQPRHKRGEVTLGVAVRPVRRQHKGHRLVLVQMLARPKATQHVVEELGRDEPVDLGGTLRGQAGACVPNGRRRVLRVRSGQDPQE